MEQKVGSAYIDIEAKLDKLEGRLTTEIKSIAQKSGQGFMSSFSQALSPLKGAIAGIVSVGAFVQLSKSIITLADNLEQAKNAFTTILGSAEAAENMLQDLSTFAAKTPFELPEVRQNAKQLLAMGVSAENIIPTLKALGDVASGTGADMNRLAMNYGQVITQGKLTTRELKDFLVNGVPLLDELAKNAGKSKEEIQNLISSGQISANDVTKAFETMTSEGGKFANMMETQSQTFTGMLSNFQDQLSQMGERIGSGFLPILKNAVDGLTELVEKNGADIEAVATQVGDTVQVLGEALREVAGELVEARNTVSDEISELLEGITGENEATTTGITGGWSDLFYYLQQGFTAIIGVVSMVLKSIFTIFSGTIENISNLGSAIAGSWKYALGGLGKWIMGWSDGVAENVLWIVNKAIEALNWMIEKANMIPGVNFDSIDPFSNTEDLKSALGDLAEEGSQQAFDNIVKMGEQTMETWDQVVKGVKESADKMVNNLEKNYIKRVENIHKKENEAFEKGLKEKAKAELETLREREKNKEKLSKAEKERMKRLAEYTKELNTSFTYDDKKPKGPGGGSGSSKAQKEALKEVKEAYKEIEKGIEKHNKAIESGEKELEKLNKKYDEFKDKAQKAIHEATAAIKEYDKALKENEDSQAKDLGERYQEVSKKILEETNKLKENGMAWLIENYSLEDLKKIQENGSNNLYDVDINKLIELQELLKEKALIEANTTEEQRKSKEFTEQTSKAQEILNKHLEKAQELEEKKAAALEKQAIANALVNNKKIQIDASGDELKGRYENEEGVMTEILDFKNIQYAQELQLKADQLEKERLLLEDQIAKEMSARENLTAEKIKLDQMYTTVHAQEINKQKSKLDEIIRKYHELAKAKASAGARGARAFGGEVKAGLPYLVGENFKPELFVPSSSGSVVPVNNYNQSRSYHFSGITINTNRGEDFRSEIQNHIGDYT